MSVTINDLIKFEGEYEGKLFRYEEDRKMEMNAITNMLCQEGTLFTIEIVLDGYSSGATMPLNMNLNENDIIEFTYEEEGEYLKGSLDLRTKILSFEVDGPRSGNAKFVGCL